jgi:predicted kinase
VSGRVILITGVMAAGKSTVAQALAERLPKSVHLRGDTFRKMIVNGRVELGFELTEEAKAQLLLRYRIAVDVAKKYAEAGFTVVYQDIILGETLREVVGWFGETPVDVVVLAPRVETVSEREAARRKTGYARAEDVATFDRVLREETPRLGLWLDNSDMTVAETVEHILNSSPSPR